MQYFIYAGGTVNKTNNAQMINRSKGGYGQKCQTFQ